MKYVFTHLSTDLFTSCLYTHSLKGYPKIFETFSSLAETTGYQANRDLQYLSKLMSISMQKLENIQLQEGKNILHLCLFIYLPTFHRRELV